MNLSPAQLEALAAAHALGTLRGGARRRLETLARQRPEVRERLLRWQHDLSSLTELAPETTPPPDVWRRIEAVVRNDLAQRPSLSGIQPSRPPGHPSAIQPTAGRRRTWPSWWGPLTGGLVLAACAGWWQQGQQTARAETLVLGLQQSVLQQTSLAELARTELAAVTRVGYVAVLSDPQAAAALLVSFDADKQQLMLRRVGTYQEASGTSLQLWTLAPGQAPKSLGVLGREARERFQAQAADVGDTRLLAVSLEPQGGVPSERGPTGPVLFKGPVLAL